MFWGSQVKTEQFITTQCVLVTVFISCLPFFDVIFSSSLVCVTGAQIKTDFAHYHLTCLDHHFHILAVFLCPCSLLLPGLCQKGSQVKKNTKHFQNHWVCLGHLFTLFASFLCHSLYSSLVWNMRVSDENRTSRYTYCVLVTFFIALILSFYLWCFVLVLDLNSSFFSFTSGFNLKTELSLFINLVVT